VNQVYIDEMSETNWQVKSLEDRLNTALKWFIQVCINNNNKNKNNNKKNKNNLIGNLL
jgi:hypothetical protein